MESIKKVDRNHETWLANYEGNSLKQNERTWRYWRKYLGSKNENWVFKNKDVEDWGAHLVNFHRWLKRKNASDNTARVRANGIRAYFKHVGIVISLTRVQAKEISSVESNPTLDYPFNLQIKTELLRVSNPVEEYIVSVGVSFGLRIGDFQLITRGMLETLLDQQMPIQLPKIQTKKEGVGAYPFIDRDARNSIQRLLKELDAGGRTKPNSRMLLLTQKQINTTFKDLFKKAGVATGGYRVRFHILRKFLTDELAKVCSGDKWKNFVGKATHTPYVSAEGRESYSKVMDFTNVNGKGVRHTSNQEIEKLKDKLTTLEKIIRDQEKEKRKQDIKIEVLTDGLTEQKELVQGLLEIVAELQDERAKK
jgi:hypothetical protein